MAYALSTISVGVAGYFILAYKRCMWQLAP